MHMSVSHQRISFTTRHVRLVVELLFLQILTSSGWRTDQPLSLTQFKTKLSSRLDSWDCPLVDRESGLSTCRVGGSDPNRLGYLLHSHTCSHVYTGKSSPFIPFTWSIFAEQGDYPGVFKWGLVYWLIAGPS